MSIRRGKPIAALAALTLVMSACAHTMASSDPQQSAPPASTQTNIDREVDSPSHTATDVPADAGADQEDGKLQAVPADQEASVAVLVNKTNALSSNYKPEDLVTVDVPTVLDNAEVNQMRKEASEALNSLFAAAEKAGHKLYARSGYRSYATQQSLYASYVAKHGEEEANRFSARPGQSEHQTGLVMDITSDSVSLQLEEKFGETEEGTWVREHAHEYGFIVRYPQGQEEITGYQYEPWHLRYLGAKLATQVHESGLTYEEYLKDKEGDRP